MSHFNTHPLVSVCTPEGYSHGSKSRAPSEHPNPHLPQNGTIGFDPQPYGFWGGGPRRLFRASFGRPGAYDVIQVPVGDEDPLAAESVQLQLRHDLLHVAARVHHHRVLKRLGAQRRGCTPSVSTILTKGGLQIIPRKNELRRKNGLLIITQNGVHFGHPWTPSPR